MGMDLTRGIQTQGGIRSNPNPRTALRLQRLMLVVVVVPVGPEGPRRHPQHLAATAIVNIAAQCCGNSYW